MPHVDCHIYPDENDKKNSEFIYLLIQQREWHREQVIDHLERNEVVVLLHQERKKAIDFLRQCEEMGIIGSLGPLKTPYAHKFKQFKGRYRLTWNWHAALFQWFWLVRKGLWQKAALYFWIAWALYKILPYPLPIVIGGFAFYFGLQGNYDYYLKKVKGEIFWPKLPYKFLGVPFWIAFLVFFGQRIYLSLT